MFERPRYFHRVGKSFVVVNIAKGNKHKVALKDIARYYATQANNLFSGCRTLGTIVGDWRPIDNLVHELLEYFKSVNIEGLRKACRAWGLIPKF